MPIDIRGFYEQYFTITRENLSGDELLVVCPFHEDTKPSLSINLKTGLWKCHAQSCESNDNGNGGGNAAKFYMAMESNEDKIVHYTEAVEHLKSFTEEVEVEPERPKPKPIKDFPVTEEDVKQRHEVLLGNMNAMAKLKSFGWDEDIIKRFEIGLDRQEKRIWIPIREGGQLVNVRKYSTTSKSKMLNVPKFGSARLWPSENLEGKEVYLFEGEKDCILANKLGLSAITVTGGSGTFKLEWAPLFQDKIVNVCYDIDLAGQKGAEKVAEMLAMTASKVNIIKLPITTPKNADFTDYILQGNTLKDFLSIESVVPEEVEQVQEEEVFDSTLDESTNKQYYFKRTRMKIRVICKHNPPYIIPKNIKVSCGRGNGKNCYVCPLYKEFGGEKIIDETTPDILEYVDSSNRQHRQIVEGIFDMPKCNFFQYEVKDFQSVEYFEAIPSLDEIYDKEKDEKYTKGEFFLVGLSAEANVDYEIESIPVSDPRSQKLVYVGYNIQPSQSSIDEFKLTDEIKTNLRVFTCQKLETN